MLDLKIILNIYYNPSLFLQNLCINDFVKLYYPINGGSGLKKYQYSWMNYDDSGDNISKFNSKLNELTSIYWFWKNYDMSKLNYIGFNHYRRLFNPKDFSDYHNYDIILRDKLYFKNNRSMLEQYQACHYIEDMKKLIDLMNDQYDDNNEFVKYITSQHEFSGSCNMFIMKKELFEQYCEYIFSIILKLKDLIDFNVIRTPYQKRVLAFLSERLTSYWIMKNIKTCGLKFKEIPVTFYTGE